MNTHEKDEVNSPDHYTHGGIEVSEYLFSKLGVQGFLDYCYGNVLKYVSRAKYKGNELKDIKKAEWYIKRMVTILEEKEANKNG